MIDSPAPYLFAALGLLVFVAWSIQRLAVKLTCDGSTEKSERLDGLPAHTIEPLNEFDWKKTKPQEIRPFKPIYYITMALRSAAPSELVIIDSNYLSRLQMRQKIVEHHAHHVLGCLPSGVEAVKELYSFLLGDYLPARYPSLFDKDEKTFHNRVTHQSLPLEPPPDPRVALGMLGETIEDDLFLLHDTPEGHLCVAMLCCFPSGFDPAEKIGKVLRDIHGPVPSYEKIGASMERFFSRLEVGKPVKRVNWSVTTAKELFNLGSNHVKEGDAFEADTDVDISQTSARIELQTLTRLPKTKAILFSFKTYLYPLAELKEEGLGLQLADAIEGLKTGNAPGMWTYKGGVRWGKSVCTYLRQ